MLEKNRVGDRASEYWEWGDFGGKVLAEVYNKIDFPQMPIYKYIWIYIKTWICWELIHISHSTYIF